MAKDTSQGPFIFTQYGREVVLNIGQEVFCYYYNEYPRSLMKRAYKRTFLEQLIDAPFKPAKIGVVAGVSGYHDYWLSTGKELYLLIKFKEYSFAKPIPVSCIQDRNEHAKDTLIFLESNKHRIGEPGYSVEDYLTLKNNL